jgi:hypothetical protein
MRSGLAQSPVITATMDLQLLLSDPGQAHRFLDLVGEIASTLQTLVVAASSKILKTLGEEPVLIRRLYDTPATSWSEIRMCKGAVTSPVGRSLQRLLVRARWRRSRSCAPVPNVQPVLLCSAQRSESLLQAMQCGTSRS